MSTTSDAADYRGLTDAWQRARNVRDAQAVWIADHLLADPRADMTVALDAYRARVAAADAAFDRMLAARP